MTARHSAMPLPPDAYAVAAVGGALLLEWLAPLRLLPDVMLLSPMTLLGVLIATGGFALEYAAARALFRSGTTTRPNGAPQALTTGGLFAVTRNPFYCGLMLVLVGVFVAGSLDWGVVVIPAFWLALDRLVVPFEERRLDQQFGVAYRSYAAATARWLWR